MKGEEAKAIRHELYELTENYDVKSYILDAAGKIYEWDAVPIDGAALGKIGLAMNECAEIYGKLTELFKRAQSVAKRNTEAKYAT